MDQKIIPMDLLLRLTSEHAITSARRSMDVMSVSGFKFDARGRLEGGVRPAPPSTEPAAYVRITRRGAQVRIECARHGRDNWCLHALILALHHLGAEPIFRTREVAAAEIILGFQLVLKIASEGLTLRIKSRSGAGFVAHPGRWLKREFATLGLSSSAAQNLVAMSPEDAEVVRIARPDAASALEALKTAELYDSAGQLWQRRAFKGQIPRAELRIKGEHLNWRIEPGLPERAQILPGWPGYVVEGNNLHRVSGYLPDLQSLMSGPESLPLTWDTLIPLMREKHGVTWAGERPELIGDHEQPGLELVARGRELHGQLGFWQREQFFPLQQLSQGRQVLRAHGRVLVTDLSDWSMSRLREQAERLRLPLDARASFSVREHLAPEFLERTQFPSAWRVARQGADRHFGQVVQSLTILWPDGGLLPRYQVGDETFEHDFLLAHLLESGGGARLPHGQLLRFDASQVKVQAKIIEGVGQLHEDAARRAELLARIASGRVAEPGPEPGAPWNRLLRSYQREGVRWMSGNLLRQEPVLLADDMGLGKTIQTLALLDGLRDQQVQLVVAPTSLLANWREEAMRFCEHRKVTVHHGPRRSKSADELAEADLVLTSYGTLLRDADLFYDVQFQVVVLDEAQAIKNANSRTAQAVAELWSDHRVALTGTPVENRMTELWSIFKFLAPGYLGAEEAVKTIYLPGTASYEALKAQVKPFVLRRKKDEVEKELPAKQEVTVLLPMEEEQEQLYQQFLVQSRSALGSGKSASAISILTRLLRLRQACCHPGLLDETLVRTPSNKVNYLVEQLEEITASGHAALVFSQFTKLLALVRYSLEEAEIPYLYLDGRSKDRQALVHQFQAGKAPVFLISLKAGGVGLNLTRASYVYHLDPWWNPAVEAQATDRAHRIGQTQHVFSYKLISKDTVEERILRLQASKRLLSEGLWQDAESLFANLDRETLMGLLG